MLFLTHLLFGVLIALTAKDFLFGGNYPIFFLLVLLGSVLPDIDEESSKITKWSGIIGRIISFFSKHRGFFHSLLFVVLVTLVAKYFLKEYYAWGLLLGLAGHLFSDGLTRKGVNFFYPFSKLKMKGWLRVGSWEEMIVILLLVLLIVWKILG